MLAFVFVLFAADDIVPSGAKLEKLFTRSAPLKGGLTEGPAVAPDGSIYFSDIPEGKDRGQILRFDPKTGRTSIFTDDSRKSNGLKFDRAGDLIACEGSDVGGRALVKWNVKTKKRTVLVDRYKGKRFNAPNDLVIDAKGRIYFTDPRYLGDEPRELAHRAVYRCDGPGKVIEITHEVEKPNGICLSPDGKTLYVGDHNNGTDRIQPGVKAKFGAMKIYAFPLGKDGLVAGKRRTVVDFGKQAGCDGMCTDAMGRLYLTVRSLKRPGIMIADPATGKELAFIATGPTGQESAKEPVGLPSNVVFGKGAQSGTLYVTIDKSLYRIKLAK